MGREYNYSPDTVAELYPGEILCLVNEAKQRKEDEFKLEGTKKIIEYLSLINIQHGNPEEVRRELLKSLESESPYYKKEERDEEGFQRLKEMQERIKETSIRGRVNIKMGGE